MKKEDIKVIFSFLSKKENVIRVVNQLQPEAVNIYEHFADNPIDFYHNILNDEYKEKFVDILEKELNYGISREDLRV